MNAAKEIGRADELGSGVRKLFKYCRIYAGADPRLLEDDIFKSIIPLVPPEAMQATMQATMQDERVEKILMFCRTPKKRDEIQKFIKIGNRDYFRKEILNPLVEQGLLHPTIPDKLTSPKQRYCTAPRDQDSESAENVTIQTPHRKNRSYFHGIPMNRGSS